ncbi:hypothetical protein BO71DRAFT_455047 [Aspergillus ellipticus CBS 707.79]|uniref:2EXR domain-containing protein n=1 Tax=Aspergillus ellipticus CBS 707.79 TaxID=1448320 RepID=A0A319E928_9EURO|nr:hypothetical protein BO71DRAFT_455047 [Aspergillus ellipticus CBS 707.79]
MSAPAVNFPLFPLLPAELRLLILEEAVSKFERPLYFYRANCWEKRRSGEYGGVIYDFNPRLVDDARFDIPLFSVNREARDVVLRWMERHGIKMCFNTTTQSFLFRRPFDPKSDIYFISLDDWPAFLVEPMERLPRPDHEAFAFRWMEPGFTQLALDWNMLAGAHRRSGFLDGLFGFNHPSLRKVFFVVNPEDMPKQENDGNLRDGCQLERVPDSPTFTWNNKRNRFDGGEGMYYSDGLLWDKVIIEASGGVDDDGWRWLPGHREIQLVRATKM